MATRKAIPLRVKRRIFNEDGPKCRYCGVEGFIHDSGYMGISVPARIKFADDGRKPHWTDKDPHDNTLVLDHIVPLSKGGDDHRSNLHVLCRLCNSRKGTKLESELIAELMNDLRCR